MSSKWYSMALNMVHWCYQVDPILFWPINFATKRKSTPTKLTVDKKKIQWNDKNNNNVPNVLNHQIPFKFTQYTHLNSEKHTHRVHFSIHGQFTVYINSIKLTQPMLTKEEICKNNNIYIRTLKERGGWEVKPWRAEVGRLRSGIQQKRGSDWRVGIEG